jgi:hypothetical protein
MNNNERIHRQCWIVSRLEELDRLDRKARRRAAGSPREFRALCRKSLGTLGEIVDALRSLAEDLEAPAEERETARQHAEDLNDSYAVLAKALALAGGK